MTTIRYTTDFKKEIVRRLLNGETSRSIELETGVSKASISNWKKEFKLHQTINGIKDDDLDGGTQYSNVEKLQIIIESSTLNEVELSEYCRKKGIFKEYIDQWKDNIVKTMNYADSLSHEKFQFDIVKDKAIKSLTMEVRKKNQIIAEMAECIHIEKKPIPIWAQTKGKDY
ncbi:MAG: helix-turn-helix domain-containing protein [Oscillospiraceae bacterium]|nr:helix-turn-helix domain-containing protein [Oscillospiraceae bacterium]